MERKLATIQRISKIDPIPNADNIEVASVLGWKVIIRKGEFKPMDLVVYFEIDSWVPYNIAPFLSKGNPPHEFDGILGERLRTIKLRGQISQGLIMPISILNNKLDTIDVGMDVTSLLGVKKYEPPIPADMRGLIKGAFPSFIPKTDETRIQAVPEILSEFIGKQIYITTKLDGTSTTYYMKDGVFGVCSRNMEFERCENTYWKLAIEYNLEEKFKAFGQDIALQGELCGPGIQKNRLNLKKCEVFFFNAYLISERRFLDFEDFRGLIERFKLQMVPVENIIQWNDTWTIEDLLRIPSGFYEGTKNLKEGVVVRPIKESYSKVLEGRMSFKIINNEFLLKE